MPHLHRGCGADRSAVGHDDFLGGQTDQRARRDGSLIDEGDSRHLGVQQGVADKHSRIDATAEGIDLEDDRRRAFLGCFG